MPIRSVTLVLAAMVLLLLSGPSNLVSAAETQMASLRPAAAFVSGSLLQKLRPKDSSQVAQAGCGLCSTVDCCGGASLGWKLCKSNCTTGYKCMQVATCP